MNSMVAPDVIMDTDPKMENVLRLCRPSTGTSSTSDSWELNSLKNFMDRHEGMVFKRFLGSSCPCSYANKQLELFSLEALSHLLNNLFFC